MFRKGFRSHHNAYRGLPDDSRIRLFLRYRFSVLALAACVAGNGSNANSVCFLFHRFTFFLNRSN
jgi:hypothetical protein